MAIINWKDVTTRYPEIGTMNKGSEEVNEAHIPYAVAELESRLGVRYAVPFESTNLTARDLAIDITYIKLARGNSEKVTEVKEHVDELIEALLSGEATMLDESGVVVPMDSTGISSTTENYVPTFGIGGPLLAEVDCTRVEDEEAARP